jgi:signal transduction histidine kinase
VFLITVLDLTITKTEVKKFTKMSKLGTSNEGSTGIGLYLCRNIIKKSRTTYAVSEGKTKVISITFNG